MIITANDNASEDINDSNNDDDNHNHNNNTRSKEGNDKYYNDDGSDDPVSVAGRPTGSQGRDSIPAKRPPHQSKV